MMVVAVRKCFPSLIFTVTLFVFTRLTADQILLLGQVDKHVRGDLETREVLDLQNEKFKLNNNVTHDKDGMSHLEVLANKKATFVVELAGEMGNHLSLVARGIVLSAMAREEYGIDANIIFKQQTTRSNQLAIVHKGKKTENILKQCFPYFRNIDFSLGLSHEYSIRKKQQGAWKDVDENILKDLNKDGKPVIRALKHVHDLTLSPSKPEIGHNATIHLPVLDISAMASHTQIDKYYERIRAIFAFDEKRCCKHRPHNDEYVFHYRNFVGEMPHRAAKLGFEELSPKKIATELFSNLSSGDTVAIATRQIENDNENDDVEGSNGRVSSLDMIVGNMTQRNVTTRLVTGQTGVQDFCFLMNAQRDLVGTMRSSFVRWAAYLGNNNTQAVARLYTLDSPGLRSKRGASYIRSRNVTWKNDELRRRIRHELYVSEEMESLIAKGAEKSIEEV